LEAKSSNSVERKNYLHRPADRFGDWYYTKIKWKITDLPELSKERKYNYLYTISQNI